MLGDGIDLQLDVAGLVVDGRDAARLRQREEGMRHQIALVARRHVAAQRLEGIELRALAAWTR